MKGFSMSIELVLTLTVAVIVAVILGFMFSSETSGFIGFGNSTLQVFVP